MPVFQGLNRRAWRNLHKVSKLIVDPVFLPERDAVRLSQLVAQIVHVDHWTEIKQSITDSFWISAKWSSIFIETQAVRSKGGLSIDSNKATRADKSHSFIMLTTKSPAESCRIFFEWKCILNRKAIPRGSAIYIQIEGKPTANTEWQENEPN